MSPNGREAIQEGLASKDAKWSQRSDSSPELKFTMKERASDEYADTVHVQGCRKDQIPLVLP